MKVFIFLILFSVPVAASPLPLAPSNFTINRGWNLVSTDVLDMYMNGCSLSDFTVYSYNITSRAYELYVYGSNFVPWSVWVYSPKACVAQGSVWDWGDNDVRLKAGWNFLPTTNKMIGHPIEEFEGSCYLKKAYMYDRGWKNVQGGVILQADDLGQGIVVKVASDCDLDFSPLFDVVEPVISGGSPSGILSPDLTLVSLAVVTDEAALCRYWRAPSAPYSQMIPFTDTSGTYHRTTVSVSAGNKYSYYVKCSDKASPVNTNSKDYAISFSVPAPVPVLPKDTVAPLYVLSREGVF
ncbi:hypothetical protein HY640_04105 [Candidatus Woesearchaeota archaeon]|nr:hypothetical protein [Candidatus Woesearchaeota archaeon]